MARVLCYCGVDHGYEQVEGYRAPHGDCLCGHWHTFDEAVCSRVDCDCTEFFPLHQRLDDDATAAMEDALEALDRNA